MAHNLKLLEGIGRGKTNWVVMAKLRVGVDLLQALEECARVEKIQAGVILSGIGALECSLVRNAKTIPPGLKMEDKYRLYVQIDKPLEMVSLSGWVAIMDSGEYNVHAHFTAT